MYVTPVHRQIAPGVVDSVHGMAGTCVVTLVGGPVFARIAVQPAERDTALLLFDHRGYVRPGHAPTYPNEAPGTPVFGIAVHTATAARIRHGADTEWFIRCEGLDGDPVLARDMNIERLEFDDHPSRHQNIRVRCSRPDKDSGPLSTWQATGVVIDLDL